MQPAAKGKTKSSRDAVSVASGGDQDDEAAGVSPAVRMVVQLLLEKKVTSIKSVEDHVNLEHAKAIKQVVLDLIAEPEKITYAQVSIHTSLLRSKTKQTIEQENGEEEFLDEVEKLKDVPVTFLWAWARKRSRTEISEESTQLVMKRGPKKFRSSISYISGTFIL